VPDREALSSLPDETAEGGTKLVFNAVSLDAQGKPIPVLNSDDGFALLFGNLSPPRLERIVATLFRPFPAGLLTPVGLVVANPAYASSVQHQLFTRNHYHGATVWSWHQALLAAGLERQLQRSDLPAGTRQRLVDAQARLWQVISSTRALQNSELWSWSLTGGVYRLEPFGQRSDDETESNAAQLWSTVFLGIPVPQSAE
jgi:glycogen debranching enzyme